MSLWLERMNELSHYSGYLREAQQHLLARQAREGHLRDLKIWCKGMSWLGSRLSAWGGELQEKYGSSAATTTMVGTAPAQNQ